MIIYVHSCYSPWSMFETLCTLRMSRA